MKNKHLVLISFDTKAGGISNMIGIHSLALVREGYSLSIILPKFSDAINSIDNYVKLDVQYKNFISIQTFNAFDKILLKLGLCKWINKIINNADACFVHNAKLISLIKNNFKKPVFAVNHTAKFSQLKFYNKADLIYAVNKKIISELINFGIDRKKCIYCPNVLVEMPYIKPKNINKKNIVIGALGRMVEKKGFYDYIDALKVLKKKGFSFKAILAGDGVLYKDLKKYALDLPELEFPGWIKNKQDFFNKIDIFCQPSHFEPFGLTVIEAMSYGKPVISTKCDGPIEIIDINKKNGILVSINNPIEITEAIINLITNSDLYINMCNVSAKHIHKFYSISNLQNNLNNSINNYFNVLHEK
tara:strand:+ start:74 stop:1150 length:1077 start_codon:yes stop_codon:yes gene_type:complete